MRKWENLMKYGTQSLYRTVLLYFTLHQAEVFYTLLFWEVNLFLFCWILIRLLQYIKTLIEIRFVLLFFFCDDPNRG